jgi:transcriptional regulator with GAF, ATPase, and Fis domain
MYSCFYIDISKDKWIKYYPAEERLVPLLAGNLPKSENKDINFIVIFSDYIPGESEVPELVWNLTGKGMRSILVISKYPRQTEKCWHLMNRGLSDIVIWEGVEPLFRLIETKERRWSNIKDILESSLVRDNLIGDSKCWKSFLIDVIEASIYSTSNILITGESGTGKELVSRLIHTLDTRENKAKLVMVDCTTVVPELSGSEFFGHEKGSYTSSVSSRDGAFALADNGTLFLDEIGELPLTLQGELLRVIQEKTYKRVGSNNWKSTNFRLICATNKDLKKLIAEGKFRGDLYYRISDVELSVPALREHSDDIELLANYFLKQICRERSIIDVLEFDPEVNNFITSKEYHGNIRELRQFIRRIAMRHEGGKYITLGSIPSQDRPTQVKSNNLMKIIDSWEESIKKAIVSGESLMDIKNIAAYLAIKIAIEMEKGDKQKAAERLNVTLRAVQQHVKKNLMTA